MSAVLRVPALQFEHVFAEEAQALAKAQRIRDTHPSIDVLVDISAPAPSCGSGDDLDVPDFLRTAALERARRRAGSA